MATPGGADNAQARDLYNQASKKMKSIWPGSSKYETAAEMLVQAGNLFKASKQTADAESAYTLAAECFLKVKQPHDAATNYVAAASVTRKTDPARAAAHLKTAIAFFTNGGHFSIAAKHLQDAGDLYEQDGDTASAAECLQGAADFYEQENQGSRASTCVLKIAQFRAQEEKYDEAVEIYEKVAKAAVENNLTKWSAKDYLFKAGLCVLCKGDVVGAKRAVERYMEVDVTFVNQRECKLLQKVAEAFEGLDVEAFTSAVQEYDSVTPLAPFLTTLLLRVKKHIQAESGQADKDALA